MIDTLPAVATLARRIVALLAWLFTPSLSMPGLPSPAVAPAPAQDGLAGVGGLRYLGIMAVYRKTTARRAAAPLLFLAAMLSAIVCAALGSTGIVSIAYAQESGLPVPRFVSLAADEVNMRTGPGVRYPVQWVYVYKNLPVEVIAEYDTWRKVRDIEGAEGWIHRAMLSNRRSAVIRGEEVTMRREASEQSPAVARLTDGVVALIDRCDMAYCRIAVEGYSGWVQRRSLWGLYDAEAIE